MHPDRASIRLIDCQNPFCLAGNGFAREMAYLERSAHAVYPTNGKPRPFPREADARWDILPERLVRRGDDREEPGAMHRSCRLPSGQMPERADPVLMRSEHS